MIELHSASAGSGKTYTLAKKYIWYLITIKPEDGPRRLRTRQELADSARHILAITFTTKATAEMQTRIVKRLFDLAYQRPRRFLRTAEDGSKSEYTKSPDYLEEFSRQLGVSHEDVAAACRSALKILLENYSEFNVSTIDSFFQLVLRTLAYESDLNMAYQVEIDTKYLSQVGVDGALEQLDSDTSDNVTRYWVKELIARDRTGWRIFERNEDTAPTYKDFIHSAERLENEEYKMKRNDLEKWFAQGHDLIAIYEALRDRYEAPVARALDSLKALCAQAAAKLKPDFPGSDIEGNLVNNFYKISKSSLLDLDKKTDGLREIFRKIDPSKLQGTAVTKRAAKNPEPYPTLNQYANEVCESISQFLSLVDSPEYRHWVVYSKNIPYLGLFGIVLQTRQEFLREANLQELAETTSILRGVIGDDETPFIYEKLGTRLNHFLIDEFQDTSKLQWESLKPLVNESLSRDNENLIIGDAKQSIYRFRNAEPRLILEGVDEAFSGRVEHHGNAESENTNYRSALRVVQFNNSFFKYCASQIDRVTENNHDPGRRKFTDLYANVVQKPAKTAPDGYVRVAFYPKEGKKKISEMVASLVGELLKRNYRQRDIAVLVNKTAEATDVVNAFMNYNLSAERENSGMDPSDNGYEPVPKIQFITNQSLLIGGSKAVQAVVGVLENIANGFNPRITEESKRDRNGVGYWNELQPAFLLHALTSTAGTLNEKLEEFVSQDIDIKFSAIQDMLAGMQSLAIPAIVEAVIARFIPEELRKKDAVFLAAFQDFVLAYCDRHPTDIASFLKWWERRKDEESISSSEGIDAVRVMTIHKSKGLEFDCVIVPFTDWSLQDSAGRRKPEWAWVEPEVLEVPQDLLPGESLPPFLPVELKDTLALTSHAKRLVEYYDDTKMDQLNKAYVAFTRAGRELYVFAPDKKEANKDGKNSKNSKNDLAEREEYPSMPELLKRFFESDMASEESKSNPALLDGNDIASGFAPIETFSQEGLDDMAAQGTEVVECEEYTVGEPESDMNEWRARKMREAENDVPIDPQEDLGLREADERYIDDYLSTMPDLNKVKAVEESVLQDSLLDDEEADLDPRSEGNIKHAVLERVNTAEDLSRAVRHLVLSGLITPEMGNKAEADLAGKLRDPNVAQWFKPGLRIINERPLLRRGHITRRPDRVVVYPGGRAVVVDYKFGKRNPHYKEQIANYVRLLRQTGRFTGVTGYIWYVNEDTDPVELVPE